MQTAYNTLLGEQKPFDLVDTLERSKIKVSLDVLVNLDKRIEVEFLLTTAEDLHHLHFE